MDKHWFVVAGQKTAKIFVETGLPKKLRLLKMIKNPLGGLKRSELLRKKAGVGVKSVGGRGSVHIVHTKRHDPLEEATNQFAKEVAQYLRSENLQKHIDELTIAAESKFLGKLKSELSGAMNGLEVEWIKKDFQNTPQKELGQILLNQR
jgi:protein required for attachment to host cells